VAEVDEQFAGFSIASLGDVRAHLVLLAVEKPFRGRGIGNQLLQWQLLAAQTAGLTDMSLEVRSSNPTAQLFYKSAGFRRIRTLPRYYCGVEDAQRLRLSPIRATQTDFDNSAPAR